MLDRLLALEIFGVKLGLTNISRLCEALDHPERSFRSVHVAGTNGKGSVTAMIHAGLRAAGVMSARYTSPHLSHLRERFVIGDAPVDDDALAAAAARVLDAADRLVSSGALPAPPTFFEAATAVAFELFRRACVEIAVIEVGLGGRFDATNVIAPMLSVITSIGFDHQEQLGTTLSSIAFEKAGIIKPDIPIVVGELPVEADTVIARVADERHAPLVRVASVVRSSARFESGRAVLDVQSPAHEYTSVRLGLRGEHQIGNAAVALRAMELLAAAGVPLRSDAITCGLESAVWPGRLELIDMPDGGRVLLDAAHNPDGAEALARYLARWHTDRPTLVFGAMRDKDIDGMLRALLPVVGPILVTAPAMQRATPPAELATAVQRVDPARTVTCENAPDVAVARGLEQHSTVCVAGSIFLVGAVRDALKARAILR